MLHDFPAAEMIFKKIVAEDPSQSYFYTNLVLALTNQGKFAKAERVLQQVLDRFPGAGLASLIAPGVASGQSDHATAEEVSRANLSQNPSDQFLRSLEAAE